MKLPWVVEIDQDVNIYRLVSLIKTNASRYKDIRRI